MAGRLLELIVLLLVIRSVWRTLSSFITVSGGARRTTASPSSSSGEPRPVKLARDPVCGTYVSPDTAVFQNGHYFCSEKCRDEFKRQAS